MSSIWVSIRVDGRRPGRRRRGRAPLERRGSGRSPAPDGGGLRPRALARRRRWHGLRRSRVCGGLPFRPKAKQAMELALREAIRWEDRWIGPGHVLLGLLRLDAMSAKLVATQGVDLERLRAEIARDLDDPRQRGG